MPNHPAALAVLSAMVAPVVLVMASSSLILATSQRLSRSIERTRKVSERLSALRTAPVELAQTDADERRFLFEQLTYAARRAGLLQQAMTLLYLSLALFVGTILVLGITGVLHREVGWAVLLLGIGGAVLLFASSVLLILETRLAVRAVRVEMHYQLTSHAPQ